MVAVLDDALDELINVKTHSLTHSLSSGSSRVLPRGFATFPFFFLEVIFPSPHIQLLFL